MLCYNADEVISLDKVKILIVEDDDKIRHVVKVYLNKEGYIVQEMTDGQGALEIIKENTFSLIILDIMLPTLDGWTICREIRRTTATPIIILSARSQEYDKLFGFELGADDYITKPFSPKEMVARVNAVLRRSALKNNNLDYISAGEIKIFISAKQVLVNNQELSLTPKEFDLLHHLAQRPNQVFTREQLLNIVWGYDYFGDARTVDTHIKQIRNKLGNYKNYVHTVWGTGYMFKLGE